MKYPYWILKEKQKNVNYCPKKTIFENKRFVQTNLNDEKK